MPSITNSTWGLLVGLLFIMCMVSAVLIYTKTHSTTVPSTSNSITLSNLLVSSNLTSSLSNVLPSNTSIITNGTTASVATIPTHLQCTQLRRPIYPTTT